MPRTCINGKVFIASNPKWGSITKYGVEVPARGAWVEEDIADTMADETDEVFCSRLNQMIVKHLVFYVTPNQSQMMEV